MYISFFLAILFFVQPARISQTSFRYKDGSDKMRFFKPVIDSLLKRGVDSNFIYSIIYDSKTQFNEKYIRVNVTGYLQKVDYSHNYDRSSVNKCKKFISENRETLQRAESKYGVPKEAIASILWIETKDGNYLGDNHIPSVFLSAALSAMPNFIRLNQNILREGFEGDTSELKQMEDKIAKRAKKKAEWALNELVALSRIYKKFPIFVLDLKGSWAGAFGISQFLPSSYLLYAVDGDNDGTANLFEMDDAIFSVANYLKNSGWANNTDAQRQVVYRYNNSSDYVDAVLKLASKLRY